ncbi:MAG: hypothetical protein MI861_18755, partial [Pirellulales bacterium]|nr:hypothetical protein [Pirellulales bacterium]
MNPPSPHDHFPAQAAVSWRLIFVTACLASLLAMAGVMGRGFHQQFPLGARPSVTVPLFNLWTYRHQARYLSGQGERYWSPEIFAPREGMLALSDPQPLTGMIFTLLQFVFSPVSAYNGLLLLILITNGVAAGNLARQVGCRWPATVAAVLMVSWMPFVAAEVGVAQMAVLAPPVWTITQLLRFSRSARLGDAVGIGAGITLSYLSSGYWGLWLALLCVAGGVGLV